MSSVLRELLETIKHKLKRIFVQHQQRTSYSTAETFSCTFGTVFDRSYFLSYLLKA